MKQTIILFIVLQAIVNTAFAQSSDYLIPKWTLEANTAFRFTPNGNTFGLIVGSDKPFWHNSKNNISLNLGLQGSFTLGMERGFEGTYGTTTNSGVHLVFGSAIYLLKSKRLILKPCVYSGWSYKSTDMRIDNKELDINQSYTDS